MQASKHTAITLVVINSERLEGRSTGSHVFGIEGGSLGSASHDDWLLQDHAARIRPGHAHIQRLDGHFCLVDRSGQTFINHATLPIGRDRRVALRDGDELRLGEYHLRVHLGDRQASQPGTQPLTALVDEEWDVLEGEAAPLVGAPVVRRDDPLEALGEAVPGSQLGDPLAALDISSQSAEEGALVGEMSASHERHTGWAGYDLHDRREAAMRAPSIQRHEEDNVDMSRELDERLLNDLERSVGENLEERWQDHSTGRSGAAGHVGADPLLRAMDAELSFRDSGEQQAFLEEVGHTLRATINGLQALHHQQDDSRYPLRDRRLQPIEDNPLRLDQPYQATVETLFSAQRSPVHLSAPAAVAECLAHQGQHQAAVEEAIGQALGAILDAFAPEALLRRFHAYRGVSSRVTEEGGWAWEMYHHYYQELNSGRQRGFEKLFWEVFEQAYDQSVRRQQREEV